MESNPRIDSLTLARRAQTSMLDVFTEDGDAAVVTTVSEVNRKVYLVGREVRGWFYWTQVEPSQDLLRLVAKEATEKTSK